jgi:type I restriction enzyme, R subunit
MSHFNEDTIEQAALELLREVGYGYVHGGEIAPGEHRAERSSYNDVLLYTLTDLVGGIKVTFAE